MATYQLFFGRSIAARGEVSDAEWEAFEQFVVTPNLPDGYTVFDAAGAWMNASSQRTIHERTKVLLVALPDNGGSAAAIDRIRHAYESRFHQMVVGMTVAPACAAF